MDHDFSARPFREPSPYPRYVVAALVPDPLAEPLAMLRQRLDRWSTQWLPPHLTIVPPFNADLTDGQQHQIAAHPFHLELTVGQVGVFRQRRSGVVWYAVEAPDLSQLIPQLYVTMPWLAPYADHRPYHAHVTVASHVPYHELAYVETAAAGNPISGQVTVEHLSLFKWDPAANRWGPAF